VELNAIYHHLEAGIDAYNFILSTLDVDTQLYLQYQDRKLSCVMAHTKIGRELGLPVGTHGSK
jgi:hypothetical protein